MMHVYGSPNTRSTRVTWALEEAGASYDFTAIDFSRGEHRSPKLLRMNPGGKVPALIDGDFILTESAAICSYIGDKFPASGLMPPIADTQARAQVLQWCFFVMSELETPLWTKVKHTVLFPEERRVPAVAETCLWEFERAAKVVSQHLSGCEYMAGEQFSAADILVSLTLGWAKHQGIGLDPTLDAYVKRLTARPALARARAREAAT
jgi:glutathione S-transferase